MTGRALIRRAAGPLWLVCLVSLAGLSPAWAAPEADVARANDHFWQGQFSDAAQGFRALAEAHPDSTDLWFNLGTAEAEAGRLGPAIHALEQAQLLTPGDEDVAHNLAAVRQRAVSKAVGRGGDDRVILPGDDDLGTGLLTAFSPRTLAWVFGTTWALLFGLIALWRRTESASRRTASSFGAVLCALVALGAGGLLVARANLDGSAHFGVVVADQAAVRSGPGDQYTRSSLVLGGVKVRLRGADGAWRQVGLPDGSDGWLQATEVAALRRPGEPVTP